MFLYIIRHGKPDYATDTLLEEGWAQARLVAKRLATGGIDEIHASPMGRARQTAQPLAEALNLPVEVEDWAYELGEEAKTTWLDGRPKQMVHVPAAYLRAGAYMRMTSEEAMREVDCFQQGSGFMKRYHQLSNGLDGMLERLGYRRTETGVYRPVSPNGKHVALFCHAGMLRPLLSHALNIPVHLLVSTIFVQFTGITILHFPREGAEDFSPALIALGDTGHLYASGHTQNHYFFHEDY